MGDGRSAMGDGRWAAGPQSPDTRANYLQSPIAARRSPIAVTVFPGLSSDSQGRMSGQLLTCRGLVMRTIRALTIAAAVVVALPAIVAAQQIGRASCRERV